jgi:hypothetical protein
MNRFLFAIHQFKNNSQLLQHKAELTQVTTQEFLIKEESLSMG